MNKPVERISRNIVRILGLNPGPFTLQGTNTYLVGSGPRRTLIDTGDGEQPEYFVNLRNTLGASLIDRILLTHHHGDHVGGISQILSSPMVTPSCTVYKHQPVDATHKDVSEGQVFRVDDVELTALLTPGHTADHVSFVMSEDGVKYLATGDMVLGQGTSIVESLGPYMQSLGRALALKPDVLLPGHGPVVSGQDADDNIKAVQVIDGYIKHRAMRERQIEDVLRNRVPDDNGSGWSEEMITLVIYPDITDPRVRRAAQNNVHLHLVKLESEGRAHRVDGRWLAD
ncbi:hypothetical protein LPJ53_004662 [Coemansia erecta]|uniref:Metallo-beta-lactamase domain-containing protein n=1 Tax=Coemansia erecta TaxID=147472 RepID=A0A9W7XZA7_9FUNG|nr:hypothetical protein LPJ53_004662 [Coemansia erecta]